MYRLSLLILPFFLFSACSSETNTSDKIQLLWQLEGLSTPESVIFDPDKNILYVSNINGGPTDKDNNGFISQVSIDGKLINLNWVEGMNAPKGLALSSNTLYVADIDALHVIDIDLGKIKQTYTAENAKFLNDVTVSKDGKVFVSDMLTNTIYCLEGDSFGVWLEDENLASPNGLHAEADHLVVGSWGVMTDGFATDVAGHLKTIDYQSKAINSLGSGAAIGNLDGVEPNNGGYLVTDWMVGKLYQIEKTGSATMLLELEQGMADHEFVGAQNLLLLPMMKNDKLLAYTLPVD